MKRTLEDRYLNGEMSYAEYLEQSRLETAYDLYSSGKIDVDMYITLLTIDYDF